ncbi:alpha-L-rhamnosidase-related protein [Mongoliitalea daihaiensis]|uniref:alpha-L-rhamnosidase-related protein n=1 Tax=Mongoliitalea daihaiensis TaxID=2782006 RepID=UPI001F35C109|nr:glycogen debranching protein [Mongoliitalea daihaiensis]UJP66255.1 glycogen debranching protein [Mongoliitalea daihaiensis]
MKTSLYISFFFLGCICLSSCQTSEKKALSSHVQDWLSQDGKTEFLSTPFFAAGDRVYLVGHQDGTFPDLGWHVEGEMGGIWNHPIKLMDGFSASITTEGATYCLNQADQFINYPIANKHLFRVAVPGISVERFQFVPDGKEGVVIEFSFQNNSEDTQSFLFNFTGHTDLQPVWLGERTGMIDNEDELIFDNKRGSWLGKDQGNDWYVLFGADHTITDHQAGIQDPCGYQPKGSGTTGMLSYNLELKKGTQQTLRFVVAGSYTSQKETERTFDDLMQHAEKYLLEKKKHYQEIASLAKISIPDKTIEEAFTWVKFNTEWLVREVPEIGRGLGAGMPDYPWWFGVDNEYTLKGAIATGRKDLVYATIELIHQLSEINGNGRIIHEVSTNGAVFNPGNINETPQFASLIWWVYRWTGDREFLATYYPTIKKGLTWLMEENDQDGNLFPDGYGMMEIHGLESEMIDVAVYTQQAFADAAAMAAELGYQADMAAYQTLADTLKEKINREFWVEDFNGFADFIGTTEEALHLIDAAIIRADTLNKPWAIEELMQTKKRISAYPKDKKQGFVIFHNWVVNTPMEMGIADPDKAIIALDKATRFVNPFGVFVTGIDRDDAAAYEDGSFVGSKVFSYTGAVMTLPTGVSIIAENNYHRPDRALDYMNRMTRSFSFALPGSIYEVSPDYGMMSQAWNLYSYGVPIVTQFFGIQPEAHKKIIHLKPELPTDWNNVSIERVLVGTNELSVAYKKTGRSLIIQIDQVEKDWEIVFHIPFGEWKQLLVNGDDFPIKNSVATQGEKITIEIMK